MSNLVWFRNDLRVDDNVYLTKACKSSGRTIGVYCFDPRQFAITKYGFKKTEKFRTKFLIESINQLKKKLAQKNISLLVYFDEPENVLQNLIEKYSIQKIYMQKEWTEEEVLVSNTIKSRLENRTVNFIEIFDQFLFHPDDIPYADFNKIPSVFTEFRKRLEKENTVRSSFSINKKP